MSNQSGWDIDFSGLMQKYSSRLDDFVKMLGLRALSSVVAKSPVDTGRFRGNWHVSFNKQDMTQFELLDPTGAIALSTGQAVLDAFDSGVEAIYIQNSLPYAMKLESGHSKQAPMGMVRVTATEIQGWIDEISRELNR
ncbi:hypothetical protein [Thorsellia kenyensis]|uniref:HK97 gp10 family phage protein n=1 Tax=Thorsellia kenyensis TaxID=1549888 RepID=A0ABV6C7Q3_9GAMM